MMFVPDFVEARPNAPAVKREAEEDWGAFTQRIRQICDGHHRHRLTNCYAWNVA